MAGTRARLSLMAMIAAALVIGLVGVGAGATPPPEEPGERLVLRLHDLPPGFFPLDLSEGAEREIECGEIHPFRSTKQLDNFVRRFSPEGCLGYYLRAYRVPGYGPFPSIAGTGAMDAGSDAAADAGFAVADDLLAALVEERIEEVPPLETVGEGARLFHWDRVPRLFDNGRLGSFLVWRSGNVLAAVFAGAGTLEASDWIATELAKRQQVHILNPTPYTRAERYAREVWLDDPALTFPVHWLGRVFKPGHGLPPIRFEAGVPTESGVPTPRVPGLPGQKLVLGYSRNVSLNSWTARGWKRFLATPDSRVMRTWRCTESMRIEIPGGHATVFAAHGRDYRVCPDRRPRLFFAFAYLDGTVTAVNFVSCEVCNQVPYGPYNSLRGMKAVVRGLVLRPKPTY